MSGMSINKARRILIVTNHFFPENFKVNEIAYSLTNYANVTVVTSRPNYPTGKFYKGYSKLLTLEESLRIFRLPVFPRRNGKMPFIFLNYLSYFISLSLYFSFLILGNQRFSHILVHHTSPPLLSLPPILYKFFYSKTRMLFWELDVWPESLASTTKLNSKGILYKLLKRGMNFIYKFYSVVLIGSKSYETILKERARNSRIEYFPNWAENIYEKFSSSKEINLPNGLNIIYAGNVGTAQNLEIIPEIMSTTKDVNFIILGDGKYSKTLQNICKKNGILDRVLFLGYRPLEEVACYIDKSDITFLSLNSSPIFDKTVPAKLMAYMAMSKPILGVISGEANTLINSSECGIAVSPGKVTKVIKAIERLKSLKELDLKKLGENGRKYYDANFRFNYRIEQLIRIIIEEGSN